MAKKKSVSPESAPAPKGRDAVRLVSGIFFAALSVYTLVALLSYLFTWAEDQSLLSRPDVWDTLVPVENGGGKIGFFWSNLLLSELFGLGAFIIPFFFAGLAIFCLKLRHVRILRFVLLSVYGAIILSVTFSFVFGLTPIDDFFANGVGGSYGHFVNEWLKAMLGATGTGAILFVLLIVWLALLSKGFVAWCHAILLRMFAPRRRKEAGAGAAAATALAAGTASAASAADMADISASATPATPADEFAAASAEFDNANGATANGAESAANSATANSASAAASANGATASDDDLLEIDNGVQMEIIQSEPPISHSLDSDDSESDLEVLESDTLDLDEGDDEEDFLKELPEESLNTLFDPRLDLSGYQSPSLSLLDDYRDKWYEVPRDELEKNNRKIVKTLNDYKIGIEKIYARTGPTVTLYEIVPSAGVRISQIKRLEDDIALSLAARGVRIIAPIPGTNAVGIEVANDKPSIVPMRSVLDDPKFRNANYDLPVVLGRTISNEAMTFDLAKMPHLLVAGATGQGKSVGLNAILTSLLYTKHPAEMKLVLVDPKKVELSLYQKIERHFLAKLPDADDAIITDTQKVVYTLRSLCIEMDSRYDLLKLAKVRNIKEYNEKFLQRRLNPLKGHRFLPFIVVVIDEFADLLMTAGREVEEPIARLAQLARAIGIHLVIATQRPTTNIITGLIKANFPARIAFRVISNIDSRTILDTTGANQLIGRGDMLFSTGGDITRVQCAFVDTHEIERVTEFIGAQRAYPTAHYLPEYTGEEGDSSQVGEVDLGKRDKLFDEAAKLVVQYQQGSTSLIQRRMNLGYNRAGRIMDQLEAAGIVGPFEGSKARQVLISDFASLDKILAGLE